MSHLDPVDKNAVTDLITVMAKDWLNDHNSLAQHLASLDQTAQGFDQSRVKMQKIIGDIDDYEQKHQGSKKIASVIASTLIGTTVIGAPLAAIVGATGGNPWFVIGGAAIGSIASSWMAVSRTLKNNTEARALCSDGLEKIEEEQKELLSNQLALAVAMEDGRARLQDFLGLSDQDLKDLLDPANPKPDHAAIDEQKLVEKIKQMRAKNDENQSPSPKSSI